MKRCTKCKEKKRLSKFHKDCWKKDGLKSQCRVCVSEHCQSHRGDKSEFDRGYYQSNRVDIREKQRVYARSPVGRASQRRRDKKRKEKFPEKIKAVLAVSNAIAAGKLKRPNHCENCKEKRLVHGHHEDYSKPLEVKWLCNPCHTELHRVLLGAT